MSSAATVDVASVIARDRLGAYQVFVIAMLTCLMLVEGAEVQAMSFAAPDLIKVWHVSRAALGPVFSASLFGYMVGALTMSPVSDRLGRKGVIIAGVLTFAAFTFAAAFATSLLTLGGARFLAGLGLGAAIPAGIALAAEYVPARLRGTIIATLFFGYSVGAGLSGFGAAWAISRYGWQAVFYLGGAIPVVLSIFLILFLPESARFLVLQTGQGAKLAKILQRVRPKERFDPAATFTVVEERVVKARVASLFTDGRASMTILLWLALITGLLGHNFLTSWIPTLFRDAGYTSAYGAQINSVFLMGGALGSLFIGPMIDRWGVGSLGMTVLTAVPMVALIGLVAIHSAPPVAAALVFAAGTCVLATQVGLSAVAGTAYPTAIRTTGAGWALGVGRIGSVSGPIVGGFLIDSGVSHKALFMLSAVPFFCSAALIFSLVSPLGKQRRRDAAPAAEPSTTPA